MSAKPVFLALATLAAGCASVHPVHGPKLTPVKKAETADATPTAKQIKAQAKSDRRARDQIGREDILTQMTFWAHEQAAHPDDLETAIKFAEALRKGGRAERAVEVASTGLDSNPGNRDLLRQYGLALVDAGRSAEAVRPLTTLCTADPKDWRDRSALGVALDEQGRFDEARKAYKDALAIQPAEPGVLTNLGVSYLLSGDAAKAESILKQAAALPNAGPETRQNLALAVGLQGRFDEAEQLQKVDLPPALVTNNMAYLHDLLSDDRRWGDLKTKKQ
jgi:Flp pilus assembly protein TadD